jgi:hypothetical protein
MKIDTDYRMIDSSRGAPHVAIELLKDDYQGIVFRYDSLKIEEIDETAILRYDFVVEKTNEIYTKEELENDSQFKSTLNRLLDQILRENYA